MLDTSYMGEIQLFGFNFAPRGWMFCAGQTMSIAQYSALFALLGTTYGGNGQSTFALPNLQSRVAIGQGQGPGLPDYTMGEIAGRETNTLITATMPVHTHAFINAPHSMQASSSAGTQAAPSVNVQTLAAFTDPNLAEANFAYNNETPDVTLHTGQPYSGAVGITGSGTPYGIMKPTLGLNFCICVEGLFPSRN